MSDSYAWMSWDCKKCNHRNLGSRADIEKCEECGSPRETRYLNFSIATPVPTTDAMDIKFIDGGARWQCKSCNAYPAAHLDTCPMCQSPKEGSLEVKTYTFNSGDLPSHSADAPIELEEPTFHEDGEHSFPNFAEETSDVSLSELLEEKKKKNSEYQERPSFTLSGKEVAYKIALFTIVFIAIGFGWWFKSKLDERHTEVVSIDTTSWTRDINISIYRWTAESSIYGYPANSRNHSTHWGVVGSHQEPRQRTAYRQVPDGQNCTTSYTDTGNGGVRSSQNCTTRYRSESYTETYYVSVDDWGTIYDYEIQKWVHSRTIHAGESDWTAFWNEDFVLATGEEYERESGRVENYCVMYTYNVDLSGQECTDSETVWLSYQDGMQITYNGFNWLVEDPIPLSEGQ